MRKLLLLAAGFLAIAIPAATLAEVQVQIRMGFPAVLPPLVQVRPGVRVVQDFDEEVFFVGGYYFVQRDGHWYRTRDHRGTWRYVKPRAVPKALAGHQPGQYRRYQHDERRAWPDAQQARGQARHWKPADHREAGPPQGMHPREGQQGMHPQEGQQGMHPPEGQQGMHPPEGQQGMHPQEHMREKPQQERQDQDRDRSRP